MMDFSVLLILLIVFFTSIYVTFIYLHIKKQDTGTPRMREIADAIHEGAIAFLHKEYMVIMAFSLVVAILILMFLSWETAIAFVLGAFFSGLSGNIGMRIATRANVRTAQASKNSLNDGLRLAFSSGLVMSLTVVSLGLFGVTVLYMIFQDPQIIYGFGLGASSIALFARVGGGIYTKAADVGADLVGKVEKGIPEDDPRNPAVIADNVGDSVGDVAGMGADLFESYVDSIIAAMVIGAALDIGVAVVILPLVLSAFGIVASVIGSLFVRVRKGNLFRALDKGVYAAAIVMAPFAYLIIHSLVGDIGDFHATDVFRAALTGLISGIIIGASTEYATSPKHRPTESIAESAKSGAGPTLIMGLSVGMLSTVIPILTICATIYLSHLFAGFYGIAIAAVGLLSILGVTLATDTYGPIADNAAGIAEMAGMGKNVRKNCEKLDEVGNTTAAVGKGFAIGSAALTTIALFVSFTQIANLTAIDLKVPNFMIGLFLGAMLPFVFSALTMQAVGKGAKHMVEEVRRQFKTIKGLMTGKAKPDYARCVAISTDSSLKAMIMPALIAICSPVIIAFSPLGVEALGGLLAGTIVTGLLLAIFMANTGGAWDNAKKYIEEGNYGGKGSDAHKAAVVGDTVGDPFKDTSGPSLNILIKLMTIVALVILPVIPKG
jgi:K(+)-stimulated pyrophosphate-energized sodium pump